MSCPRCGSDWDAIGPERGECGTCGPVPRAEIDRVGTEDGRTAGETLEDRSESKATRLVGHAIASGAEFFHTPVGEAFAAVPVDGHTETIALRGKGADLWLRRIYYDKSGGKAPSAQAVNDALLTLRSRAIFAGEKKPVLGRD